MTAEEEADIRQQLAKEISAIPIVNIGSQDVQIERKAVSLRNVPTPWAFARRSFTIGFRF